MNLLLFLFCIYAGISLSCFLSACVSALLFSCTLFALLSSSPISILPAFLPFFSIDFFFFLTPFSLPLHPSLSAYLITSLSSCHSSSSLPLILPVSLSPSFSPSISLSFFLCLYFSLSPFPPLFLPHKIIAEISECEG